MTDEMNTDDLKELFVQLIPTLTDGLATRAKQAIDALAEVGAEATDSGREALKRLSERAGQLATGQISADAFAEARRKIMLQLINIEHGAEQELAQRAAAAARQWISDVADVLLAIASAGVTIGLTMAQGAVTSWVNQIE